jgi:hypothetical protein
MNAPFFHKIDLAQNSFYYRKNLSEESPLTLEVFSPNAIGGLLAGLSPTNRFSRKRTHRTKSFLTT